MNRLAKHIPPCLFLLAAAAQATPTYFEVLDLDRSTVLCDSRNSECDPYRDQIRWQGGTADAGAGVVDGQISAGFGSVPLEIIFNDTDFPVRITSNKSATFNLGRYALVGVQAGTLVHVNYRATICGLGPGRMVGSPIGANAADCLSDPDFTAALVAGEPFDLSFALEYADSVTLYPRDFYGVVLESVAGSISTFGTGSVDGQPVSGLSFVPVADAPEPSTFALIIPGIAALAWRRFHR